MFRSTRKSALGCVTSSTSSVLPLPHCWRAGLLTISPPTSCCENAISLLALASFYLVPSNGSPSCAGPDWPRARTSRGLLRGSGPARPSGCSALDGSAPWPNLNEFFVHHEDVRRANRQGPRRLTPAMDAALWRNVRLGSRYLSRRLRACGLEIEWAGTNERVTVRLGEPTARLDGLPGELLLYVFGRQAAAQVEVSGPPGAVALVRRTHFGM